MKFKKYKLKDLVDNFSVRARDYGGSDGLEFLGVSNDDGIVKSKSAAEHKGEEYKIIEKGCFAYNPYRINIGSIAYFNEDIKGLISPAYVIFKTKPNTIKDNLLFKFLKSAEGLRQIRFHGRGTVRQALRFEDLCKIEISLPCFEEQEKLISSIEKTEIESNLISSELTQQLNLIKQLRQAFLREAMQGKLVKSTNTKETGTQLLEKIKVKKTRLIAEKKLKKEKELPPITEEEIPFEIPEHWAWCKLGEICTLITDGKHGDCKNELNSGYYFLSAKDIQNGQFIYDGARQITYDDFLETHRRTNLEPGDLCIVNTGATIGKSAFAPEDEKTKNTTFQKSVAIIKVLKEYTNMRFVENFITNETPRLLKKSRGSAINNLLLGDMRNTLFPLPPLHEQEQIVAKLEKLMAFCDELEESIKESQGYTEKLLQEVLREALKG